MKGELADRESPAYHELGRCFVYAHYGCKIVSVEVGDSFGSTTLAKQAIDEFDRIVALCAGKASVDRFYGWKAAGGENWKASDDFRNAYAVALRVSQNDAEAAGQLIRWAERVADVLIERYWSKICKSANILVERGKVELVKE